MTHLVGRLLLLANFTCIAQHHTKAYVRASFSSMHTNSLFSGGNESDFFITSLALLLLIIVWTWLATEILPAVRKTIAMAVTRILGHDYKYCARSHFFHPSVPQNLPLCYLGLYTVHRSFGYLRYCRLTPIKPCIPTEQSFIPKSCLVAYSPCINPFFKRINFCLVSDRETFSCLSLSPNYYF